MTLACRSHRLRSSARSSPLLFASIDFSYGQTFDPHRLTQVGGALVPFLGTVGLGAARACGFKLGGHSREPVIASHVLVLLLAQPWPAAAY